jgi:hypothetical protein
MCFNENGYTNDTFQIRNYTNIAISSKDTIFLLFQEMYKIAYLNFRKVFISKAPIFSVTTDFENQYF